MKMPQLVGKTVTHAQFALRGSITCVIVDHRAKDPGIIWPGNWTVCQQEPAPGVRTTGPVKLTVVRRGETCSAGH